MSCPHRKPKPGRRMCRQMSCIHKAHFEYSQDQQDSFLCCGKRSFSSTTCTTKGPYRTKLTRTTLLSSGSRSTTTCSSRINPLAGSPFEPEHPAAFHLPRKLLKIQPFVSTTTSPFSSSSSPRLLRSVIRSIQPEDRSRTQLAANDPLKQHICTFLYSNMSTSMTFQRT
jgi:hypothetical protein